MIFVQKIFTDVGDSEVHEQFVRFGKGVFENRALSEIKVRKEGFHLYASYDLLQDLYAMIQSLNERYQISGLLIVKRKKQEINQEVDAQGLKEMIAGADFALLDIESTSCHLACKKKIPKPGKNLDVKFVSADLPPAFLSEFLFDGEGKQASISHTFQIDEIVVPKGLEHNPEEARLQAQRKGTIIRRVTLDGQMHETRHPFCV